MDLVYFIVLVSSLVFVHELGHFMLAKAFGVKVLTFSLGFGPKLLKIRGRETEYCIGLLPLGGYVKLLESSKADVVFPEDQHRTFESLPLFKRAAILLAGPLMNLLFPLFLYFSVFAGSGPFLAPTVGIVLPGHPAEGFLKPGDRIMAIDEREVGSFEEVKRMIAKSAGQQLTYKIFRDNQYQTLEISTGDKVDVTDVNAKRVGTIGIQPSPPASVIGIRDASSPAYRAGLRTFDVVTHVAGKPVRRYMDLEAELLRNRGETVPITYFRPISLSGVMNGLGDMAIYEAGVVALTPQPEGESLLERTGIELGDLYTADIPEGSMFYRAGLRLGDRIVSLDGQVVPAWSAFEETLLVEAERPHRIEFWSARYGQLRSGMFQMRRDTLVAALERLHWVPLAPEKMVEHPALFRYAAEAAFEETADVTRFLLTTIASVVRGDVAMDSVIGPLALYEVVGSEGRKGYQYFIWLMALLSINLGLLNLLPIPVLDGGQLLFAVVEGITRKPLPLRFREVAHVIGMILLFSLMIVAIRNDLTPRFDGIWQRFHGIFG